MEMTKFDVFFSDTVYSAHEIKTASTYLKLCRHFFPSLVIFLCPSCTFILNQNQSLKSTPNMT